LPSVDRALELGRSRINWLVFPCGIGAAVGAFGLQWFCNAFDYPLNVGGRQKFAIPAFIPITFEMGVLFSAFAGLFFLFWILGLPRLSHPLFAVEGFERATIDRFWLAVDAADPKHDVDRTSALLGELGAARVQRFGMERR
jgi:hypothetical protein